MPGDMRDYKKLRAFELADALALSVYRETAGFPKEERYGLTSQMRRCAVSVASNIVEGSARKSLPDYLKFLDIAYGSVRELEYQISLATRLEFIAPERAQLLESQCVETIKVLNGLIMGLRRST
jgi:four helix bundle protein